MSNNPLLRWGLYLSLGGVVLLSEIAAGKTVQEIAQLKSLPALGYLVAGGIMAATEMLPEQEESTHLMIEKLARPGMDKGSSYVFDTKYQHLLANAADKSRHRSRRK